MDGECSDVDGAVAGRRTSSSRINTSASAMDVAGRAAAVTVQAAVDATAPCIHRRRQIASTLMLQPATSADLCAHIKAAFDDADADAAPMPHPCASALAASCHTSCLPIYNIDT